MLKKFPVIILITILIMDVLPSCYDKDFLDISDSVRWHPSFSLPVGSSTFEVNNFFASLIDTTILNALDSFPVEFNDSLMFVYQEKIPLEIDSLNYSFEDITDEYDKIDSMLFRVCVENGFPTNAEIQIYLADSADNIIDSLFTVPSSNFFPPAKFDADEKVIEPSIGTVDIPFNRERLDNVKNAKNILFNVNISVTNDDITTVKFYSSYNILVKLGVRVAFHMDISVSDFD